MKSLYVLLRWLLHSMKHRHFCVNVKSEERNKPVAILANGPSLNEAIKSLRTNGNEIDFCMVNFSPLTPEFFELKPKYLVLYDGGFFSNAPRLPQQIQKQVEAINRIDWEVTIITGISNEDQAKLKYGTNPNVSILSINNYIIPNHFANNKIRFFMFDRGLSIPVINNVVQACIFAMILLGYQKVYLYGVEHSFVSNLVVDDNNVVCVKDTHYYDKGEAPLVPLKCRGVNEKLHEQLLNLYETFRSYWVISEYAISRNVRIINKTKGSFIDAFEKEV